MRAELLRVAGLLLAAFFLLGMGARPSRTPDETAAVAESAAQRPTPEMLEFLADFATTEGRFIDPLALRELATQTPRGENHD